MQFQQFLGGTLLNETLVDLLPIAIINRLTAEFHCQSHQCGPFGYIGYLALLDDDYVIFDKN